MHSQAKVIAIIYALFCHGIFAVAGLLMFFTLFFVWLYGVGGCGIFFGFWVLVGGSRSAVVVGIVIVGGECGYDGWSMEEVFGDKLGNVVVAVCLHEEDVVGLVVL